MVGKLLKHEFRATARVMLLVYAAVAAAAILANLSIRFMDQTDSLLLELLFGLVIALFVLGLVAAVVVTAVVMIGRFYRSLLKERGYLMHTLPVTVHGHIWAKLITSLVWFVATFAVVWLLIGATLLIQSGTDLGELLRAFPSWSVIVEELRSEGVGAGSVAIFGIEGLCYAVVSCLTVCLHFYAAMALGHMFAKHRILWSIAFFIGINMVLSFAGGGTLTVMAFRLDNVAENLETLGQTISFAQMLLGQMLVIELIQAALLYVGTWLPLRYRLNLA